MWLDPSQVNDRGVGVRHRCDNLNLEALLAGIRFHGVQAANPFVGE
jgi:hypothetical protein